MLSAEQHLDFSRRRFAILEVDDAKALTLEADVLAWEAGQA